MPGKTTTKPRITKFTNCRLVRGASLVEQDLWIDSLTGKILKDQEAFYELHLSPDEVIDLGGRILAPGLIDVQLNGAHGFDFSVPCDTKEQYDEGLRMVNRGLARSGVTSYLPTLVSSTPEVYWKVSFHLFFLLWALLALPTSLKTALSHLVLMPRDLSLAPVVMESTNQPFSVLPKASKIWSTATARTIFPLIPPIKMITAAPEVGKMMEQIPEIAKRNIIYSIGHSDATYEQAVAATHQGARMITHLFNAMRPFYHRNPGIFGVLGQSDRRRPCYGVIADGIHLHPTSIKIAYNAYPDGLILVTDAMRLCGLPDGVYDWTNGERIVKTGARLTLEGSDKIAGSSATLIECVNNFRRWSGSSTAEAINAATAVPARLLGLEGVKGSLSSGADADLVVLGEVDDPYSGPTLTVDQVWKLGVKIHDNEKAVAA
ncbi:hypothetical protein N7470_009124 [Penicillium chermesinum]|nr:hypothetical protein N7470_009124 [Penicillium chermesinum]